MGSCFNPEQASMFFTVRPLQICVRGAAYTQNKFWSIAYRCIRYRTGDEREQLKSPVGKVMTSAAEASLEQSLSVFVTTYCHVKTRNGLGRREFGHAGCVLQIAFMESLGSTGIATFVLSGRASSVAQAQTLSRRTTVPTS